MLGSVSVHRGKCVCGRLPSLGDAIPSESKLAERSALYRPAEPPNSRPARSRSPAQQERGPTPRGDPLPVSALRAARGVVDADALLADAVLCVA